jgi:hypothetical protein
MEINFERLANDMMSEFGDDSVYEDGTPDSPLAWWIEEGTTVGDIIAFLKTHLPQKTQS